MRTVLAVTDFSPTAKKAVDWAAFFARHTRARLLLLHVVPGPGNHPVRAIQERVEQALQETVASRKQAMEELVASLEREGLEVSGEVQVGRVVDRIVETSALADLLVLGVRGEREDGEGGFIGSTAYRIIAGTTQPVLAVPHNAPEPRISRILVPVDLSPVSLQAILKALEIAGMFDGVHVDVLHVVEILESISEEEVQSILQEEIWREIRQHLPEIHPHGNLSLHVERRFNAAPAILDKAQELHADLIVMRTHGRHGILKSLMGSTTEQVLRGTPCPVYAFRF